MVLGEKQQGKVIVVPTQTIIHPFIYLFVVKCVHHNPRNVLNINQARQALQRHPILLNDSDHDYIFDKIGGRNKIECERNLIFPLLF